MRRSIITVLTLAVVATACGGGTSELDPTGATAAPRSADLRTALADAGIVIVEDPASAPPPTAMQLWAFQVENMEREYQRGGGYLGTELDELMGSPGGMPFSYLLAGWITSGVSEASDDARALMGDAEWNNAPAVIYPTGVLTLFVADALDASGATEARGAPLVQLAAYGGDSVCETVAGWVKSALDFIFDGLKVDSPGDGFLGWLGTVWNTALDLARGAVESLIDTLTAPVVDLITSALAVVGTLTMIASLLTPWGLEVIPSQPTTRVAIGNEPDIRESFEARVDTNIDFEWPREVQGCANVADIELPDPSSARGATIEWTTYEFPPLATAQIPDMGTVTGSDQFVGSSNTAALRWETGRQETDEGDTRVGSFSVKVVVTSDEALKLKRMIQGLISGRIPSEVPFASDIENYFKELTEPVLDKLVEFAQVRGDASMNVLYYFEEEEDEEEETTTTGAEAAIDFSYLDQRHTVWVSADARSEGTQSIVEREIVLNSFDEDVTRQSTVQIDRGEPMPIDPIGLSGFIESRSASASAGSASAGADASVDFQTEVSKSQVRISGLYDAVMSGSAAGDDEARTIAVASSGVRFRFTGGTMQVVVAWNCDVTLGLMVIENGERGEVLIDNNSEECAGRFEGMLQPDTVYQLLASAGLSQGWLAANGRVVDAVGNVIRSDAAAFNQITSGDFRLILTPAG